MRTPQEIDRALKHLQNALRGAEAIGLRLPGIADLVPHLDTLRLLYAEIELLKWVAGSDDTGFSGMLAMFEAAERSFDQAKKAATN